MSPVPRDFKGTEPHIGFDMSHIQMLWLAADISHRIKLLSADHHNSLLPLANYNHARLGGVLIRLQTTSELAILREGNRYPLLAAARLGRRHAVEMTSMEIIRISQLALRLDTGAVDQATLALLHLRHGAVAAFDRLLPACCNDGAVGELIGSALLTGQVTFDAVSATASITFLATALGLQAFGLIGHDLAGFGLDPVTILLVHGAELLGCVRVDALTACLHRNVQQHAVQRTQRLRNILLGTLNAIEAGASAALFHESFGGAVVSVPAMGPVDLAVEGVVAGEHGGVSGFGGGGQDLVRACVVGFDVGEFFVGQLVSACEVVPIVFAQADALVQVLPGLADGGACLVDRADVVVGVLHGRVGDENAQGLTVLLDQVLDRIG